MYKNPCSLGESDESLEDIEFNQWNISQDTKSKLKELIK